MRGDNKYQYRQMPKSVSYGVPVPTAGWITNSSIDNMPPNSAIVLDNFFPDKNKVKLRRGYSRFAYGLTGYVYTLIRFYGTTSEKLISCNDGKLFDISAGGDMSAETPIKTGYTDDKWQYVNFKDRVFAFNGADAPWDYDGNTHTVTSWSGSGLTNSNLIYPTVYTERLFMVEKDSSKFWYADVGAVTGTLTSFDLSQITKKGGKLQAIGSLSVDGGDGLDDYFVAVMSTGEVLIYAGTDPSDADKWSLVGKYSIPEPVGQRCLANYGGDLVCITKDGFIPIKQFIASNLSRYDLSLSDLISNALRDNVEDTGTSFGWQAILYPRRSWLIFNAPQLNSNTYYQYIMNTTTGAWCRFTNQNALCFDLFEDDLYFGTSAGVVYKADNGYLDYLSNVKADLATAYNYLGNRGGLKKLQMVRPLINSFRAITAALAISVDYDEQNVNYTSSPISSGGSDWDVSFWDTSFWSPDNRSSNEWLSPYSRIGYAFSIRLKIDTEDEKLEINSFDVRFQQGTGI